MQLVWITKSLLAVGMAGRLGVHAVDNVVKPISGEYKTLLV
jgi:hypothetical protein